MPDRNRLIRLPELLDLVPFSRSHIHRLEKRGKFPRRLKLGMRRIAWRENEILRWIHERT